MPFKHFFSLKALWLTLLSVSLFFAACKKAPDNDNTPPDPVPEALPDLTTKVTTAVVSGFISNENDAAVQNATVEVGGTTVNTDKYGYFEVRNKQVVQNAATVTVTKTGYFKTVKTFIATAGKSAFFRIKLLPKTVAGSVTGSSGGTVTLAGGMAIALPAGSVVNASTNATYTGTVSVSAQLISAADADLNRKMPGDLRGLNTSGNIRLLTTYGMMAVELTGSGGELLQIAAGKKATITMPIPAAMQASAPATIPLWYFDEAKGLWKEEGSATKTGSNYTGEVSHFSFWNYDVPANYVQFNCTLMNQNGGPLQNVLVKITVVNSGEARYGFTDSTGYISGAVPNNAALRMEVYSNTSCPNAIYNQNFTTVTSNISLGTVTVNTTTVMATVTGTVTNCAGQPLSSGYIIMQSNSQYFRYPVTNGNFNFSALLCSAPAAVSVITEDPVNGQQSASINYTLSAGNNALGNIQACGVTTQQFINYTINGTPYSFTAPADSLRHWSPGGNLVLISGLSGGNRYVNFEFPGTGIGLNSTHQLNYFYTYSISDSMRILTPVTLTITEYGAVGQFISGNFSGTFTGSAPANIPYVTTLNFRVKRTF